MVKLQLNDSRNVSVGIMCVFLKSLGVGSACRNLRNEAGKGNQMRRCEKYFC